MKKADVLELDESPAALNGVHGYRPRLRTRRVVADRDRWPEELEAIFPMWPDEGQEPFWADIKANLTFDDLDSLRLTDITNAEQWDIIAPWVLDWNAMAWDQMSKSWQPVPPPAEAGIDALRTQEPAVTAFLVLCIKNSRFGTDLPKGPPPSGDTDDG